ncbi:MAG: hypothetical protein M0Z66_13095 [Thermaerobacter sp.]|nr:hypothetical protein [Thermaerobacter sp.]
MLPESHQFYDLERLWGDAPTVAIERAASNPQFPASRLARRTVLILP